MAEIHVLASDLGEHLTGLSAKLDDPVSSSCDGNEATAAIGDAAFDISSAMEISVIDTDMTVVQAPGRFGTPNGIEWKILYV